MKKYLLTAAIALASTSGASASYAFELPFVPLPPQSVGSYVQPDTPGVAQPGTPRPTGTPLSKPTATSIDLDLAGRAPRHSGTAPRKLGLGLSLSWPNHAGNGPSVGIYQNAERGTSAYAGYAWSWQVAGPISAQILLGAATGYKQAAVVPVVMPSIAAAITPAISARLNYAAKAKAAGAHGLHLSLDYKF